MYRRLQTVVVFAILLGIAVVGRLLARELTLWNFTPLAAVGLFAGFFFEKKSFAALLSVAALTISNLFIGGYGHWGVMAAVYAGLLFPILLRGCLRPELLASRVLGTTILSSVVFFLLTNCAHWWFTMSHTSEAFVQAFVAAVPFFRSTFLGDLFFSSVLFGGYAWAVSRTSEMVPVRVDRKNSSR